MKKFLITLLSVFFVSQIAFAGSIEILPTMQSKSTAKDKVWVGTFQLVWNDFMDKYVHGVVKLIGGTPQYVEELNTQEIKINDIDDNSFYKYSGKITKNTKKTIESAIKKKFNETSDILGQLDLTPASNRFLIYAMLKKDFKFVHAFDKLGKSDFRNNKADFFGITRSSNQQLRDSVTVLFYNSNSDYAVKLNTVGNDEVFLYKTPSTNSFNYIYSDMIKKQAHYNGKTSFAKKDELKVPNLDFFEQKEFSELAGKRVKGTQLQIDQAIETIKFKMNNEGVKLKSEAAIAMQCTSVVPEHVEIPRYFYFNNTFVMFLKEKTSSKPYFALRVYDITNFQK